jgi:hypothetical protein
MATDSELLQELRKKDQQRAATSTSRQPWQEVLSRSTTVPASKSVQAAEVIAGMSGGWGSFIDAGLANSYDGAIGYPSPPQVKANKIGQPGLPEINFVPYNVGTNRFGSKGPSLLGHPISMSILGPTAKNPASFHQWSATDNSTLPVGDVITLDTVDSALSTLGSAVPPIAATILDLYNIPVGDPDTTYPGGLYIMITQTGATGAAPVLGSGLSDGNIGDSAAAGKSGLVPVDQTSKYEIFRVIDVGTAFIRLHPSKRLVDYFTFPATPAIRSLTFFQPHVARMVAVPGSGTVGAERAHVVVPPSRAATGEYLPVYGGGGAPGGTWTGGGFDLDDPALVGATPEYTEKVQLPIPRPIERRLGRTQLDSDGPLALTAGQWHIFSVGYTVVAGDVGKILRVFRTERTGTAPYGPSGSTEGDNTDESRFLGWYEVIDFDGGRNAYICRRVTEVDPLIGRPFFGSSRSLWIDDSGPAGNLNLHFTVHDSIESLHSAPYNDPDKLASARLQNLIDPSWVERSVKTPGLLEGASGSRPDRAMWDTRLGANPGSFLDMGFRMVLYPAVDDGGSLVPDFEAPITSREVVLDPSITDEVQYIDIDYSSGVMTFSHTPVPGAGCQVAPNGIISADNPRGELVLFAACVPYSMEEGQTGSGIRITTSDPSTDCSAGLNPQQTDIYGERVSHQVKPLVDGAAQIVASGKELTLVLDGTYDDYPETGYLELRAGSSNGPPALVGPSGEPLGLYHYTLKSRKFDTTDLIFTTSFIGVTGGGLHGVDTVDASAADIFAVLRRDIRAPVSPDGIAGTNYEHDTTYGFAKKTDTLHFNNICLEYRPDGSLGINTASQQVDILVGDLGGVQCECSVTHFETLGEAVAHVGEVTEGGSVSGQSWRIVVVGPTNETTTPIVMPTGGIHIEGAELRQAGLGLTQTSIKWDSDGALIDLNGQPNLTFENLAFEFDGAPAVSAAGNRSVFTNDPALAGGLTVSGLRVARCTFLGNSRGHGFLKLLSFTSGLFRATFEDINSTSTDYGFLSSAAMSNCTWTRCNISKAGAAQGTNLDAFRLQATTVADNRIVDCIAGGGFKRGFVVRHTGGGAARNQILGNLVGVTDEIGVQFAGSDTIVKNNVLDSVHRDSIYSYGQPDKVGIWQDGVASPNSIVKDNVVILNTPNAASRSILLESDIATVESNNCNQEIETVIATRIIGNDVSGGAANGIRCGTDSFVRDNQMVNLIVGARTRVSGNTISGILYLEDDIKVIGNELTGTAGLLATSPRTGVVIKGNTIGTGGFIGSPELSQSVIEGNFCKGNIDIIGDENNISDNLLPEVGGDDIAVRGNNNTVANNTLSITSVITVHAPAAATADYNVVEGNDVGFIVETAAGGGVVSHTIIKGNHIRNVSSPNMLTISSNSTIEGNKSAADVSITGGNVTVTDNQVDDLTVVGDRNVISDNKASAYTLTGDSLTVTGNEGTGMTVTGQYAVIKGNQLEGGTSLTYATAVPGTDIGFSIIEGNWASTIDVHNNFGSNIIKGNHCLTFIFGDGAAPSGGDGNTVTDNRIFNDVTISTDNNTFTDNRCLTLTVGGDGNSVSNNRIVGAGGSTVIDITGGATNLLISDNHIGMNSTTDATGVNVGAVVRDAIISDNIFQDNKNIVFAVGATKRIKVSGNKMGTTLAGFASTTRINGSALTSTATDIQIVDNQTGHINMGGAGRVKVSDNTTYGGQDFGAVGSPYTGIYGTGTEWMVTNNRVMDTAGTAESTITLTSTAAGTGHIITGNICAYIGTTQAGAGGLAAGANVIAHSNRVTSGTVYGSAVASVTSVITDNAQ